MKNTWLRTLRTARSTPSSVDHALLPRDDAAGGGALTVTEAAERLGVARSTAHRLLSMLLYRDFAVQDEDRRLRRGARCCRWLPTRSRALPCCAPSPCPTSRRWSRG